MDYDHKTIQQVFSSLVFYWFKYLAEEKGERKTKRAVNGIKKIRGENWHSMPMI
jgi:hypothetical protein